MKVQPTTHLRVTQGDKWIIASTDEYLKAYDKSKGSRTFNRKMQIVRANEGKKELAYVCKRDGFKLSDGHYIMVFMKHMPKTWRKGKRKPCKRDLMAWKPLMNRPDIDNFVKKLFDSLLKEDKIVWCLAPLKIWIPDEIEEGTYFINVPPLFETIVNYVKETLT